jgi:eukaryotic-like serine/threonine-protein kinase
MAHDAPDSLLGALVDGRYTLQEEVGHGGFGKVFRADDFYGTPCALKLVPLAGASARMGAQREAARLEQNTHPGLVAFRGVGRFGHGTQGYVYIAMELGQESLHDRIHRVGPLPSADIKDLALALLDTLDHLHARGLVHADVKPGNLVRVGDRWKLCDLGAASPPSAAPAGIRSGDPAEAERDRDPPWSGTPEFMAPEVFDGDIGPAADLWSLGLMIHECATGRSPFRVAGKDHEAIARRVRRTDPRIDRSLPGPLAAVVRGCLERDPAHRLTSREVRLLLAAPLPARAPGAPLSRAWVGWVGAALAWGAALGALAWEVARG